MNQRDRDRLSRLYVAVRRWPWWNRKYTRTPAALAGFADRMERLQPLFADAVVALGDPLGDPDGALSALEMWLDDDRATAEAAERATLGAPQTKGVNHP